MWFYPSIGKVFFRFLSPKGFFSDKNLFPYTHSLLYNASLSRLGQGAPQCSGVPASVKPGVHEFVKLADIKWEGFSSQNTQKILKRFLSVVKIFFRIHFSLYFLYCHIWDGVPLNSHSGVHTSGSFFLLRFVKIENKIVCE